MRFYLHTFGCRVNWAESTRLALELLSFGFEETGIEQANILIINSCAVTERAVRQVRQLINQAKKQNPKIKIYLTGCCATYWQKEGLINKQIDGLYDNSQKANLAKILKEKYQPALLKNKKTSSWGKFLNSSRLMLKVQDGCNYFCTYCIVPYLRGLSKSIEPELVVDYYSRVSALTKINELVLTGINLGLYQTKNNQDFAYLVRQLLNKTKVPKISFGSLYTENLNTNFLKLYQARSASRLSQYFHIPIQSGSDKILKLMRRRYCLAEFNEKILALSQVAPDGLLATDVIVGFLEETDADFEATYRYLEKSPFVRGHIFKYSPRQFTSGYYLGKKLSEPKSEVKKKRSLLLRRLFQKKLCLFKQNLFSQKLRALVIKSNSKFSLGFLDNGLEVIIPVPNLVVGFVNVKITKLNKGKLVADLVS